MRSEVRGQDPARRSPRLRRDGLTWAAYAWLCGWAFYLYGLGAVLVFLIDGQQISRSVAGLHLLAQAAGAFVAGLVSVHLVRALARRGVILAAAVTLTVGLLLLAAGAPTPLTVAATFVLGLGGSLGLISVNSLLSDHHGVVGVAVITEANAFAVAGGVASPVLIGASAATPLGWRAPLAIAAAGALGGALWLSLRCGGEPALHVRVPPRAALRARVPTGVPTLLALTVLVVAVEFLFTSWTVDLVRQRLTVSETQATAAGSGLLLGMALSRASASRLTLRLAPPRVLLGSLLVALAGWSVLWAAGSAPLVAVGLLASGLGIGACFPLSLGMLLQAAGRERDRVSAHLSTWIALGIGVAPFALGALADLTSLRTAFVVVPVVLLASVAMLRLAGRVPAAA